MKFFFPTSLYGKVLIVVCISTTCLGGLQFYILRNLLPFGFETLIQRTYWNSAEEFARDLQPLLRQPVYEQVQGRLLVYSEQNPAFELYIVDRDGSSIFNSGDYGINQLQKVDIEAIEEFLKPEPNRQLPLKGTHPHRNISAKVVFSAARVQIENREAYLYLILTSRRVTNQIDAIRDSYFLVYGVLASVFILLYLLSIGLAVHCIVTRRFRKLASAVHRFYTGDLEARAKISGDDEIGALGKAVDEMAETTVRNLEQIRSLDKQRRNLVAMISHDIRSPLTVAKGFAELLRRKQGTLTQGQVEKYLDLVIRNISSQEQMVDDLFELSKLDLRERTTECQNIVLRDVIEALTEKYQTIATENGITLSIEPESVSGAVTVWAERGLLERALSNLIENALRHTNPGGSIFLRTIISEEDICFEVQDTGSGIPESDLPHIFDLFYRAKEATHPEGAGLGLAIVKKIVDAHRGTLDVESQLQKGTMFRLVFGRSPK